MSETGAGRCAVCGNALAPADFFVVRIEGFYTPDLPDFSAKDIENATRRKIEALQEKVAQAGVEGLVELEEEVYKRYTYRMCRACYKRYITRPLPERNDIYE